MKNPYQKAVEQYKSIELQTRVESASPHELIDLLLQGARSNIATAQGHIERNKISEKGLHISKAISIIEGLRTSLDFEQGGDIAVNLDKLYDYIQQILLKANIESSQQLLGEANLLLGEIHQAWQNIPKEVDA